MEYSIRCNRFREAEKINSQKQDYRDIRNQIKKASFEHASYHKSGIMFSPERVKPNHGIRVFQVQPSRLNFSVFDPQSDRFATRNHFVQSTVLNREKNERASSAPRSNISHSVGQTSFSAKKKKTHYLTVISRLPGMSKTKKAI